MIKLIFIPLLAILTAQTETLIPCSVKTGKHSTVLTCKEGRKTTRLVIPRSAYRFANCSQVNLVRKDGKLTWADAQSCHIIDTKEQIAACEKFNADTKAAKGYDAARDPNFTLPNCTRYWLNAEGEELLVPPHLVQEKN